ncbi:hypothetical protein Ccrd_009063 [Cynara cardunculus var. scolymus]|uniref:Uncharacterized protein n=1 Tax=Cynara cardunculus var. scolymus TaxID=59895 RepID=A0A103YNT8_CYNCS|nr:hypothetical protein Ccrd_009063 [Cynara cardunculus var. scolymus]
MAEFSPFSFILTLLIIAGTTNFPPPATARIASYSRDEASCTMCDECENPCQLSPPLPSPPPPVPSDTKCPPPPSPPPSSGGNSPSFVPYYSPPPPPATPAGGYGYTTPPPPNPILPYFPFYYYNPPPPGQNSLSLQLQINCFHMVFPFYFLIFLLLLV